MHSRRIKWTRHMACIGEMKNAYRFLARKSEGKRPHGRPRHMWEDNIKTYLKAMGYDGVASVEIVWSYTSTPHPT
jgi:hypothetical protein